MTLTFVSRSIAFFSKGVCNAIDFIGEIYKLLSFIAVEIFAKLIN